MQILNNLSISYLPGSKGIPYRLIADKNTNLTTLLLPD